MPRPIIIAAIALTVALLAGPVFSQSTAPTAPPGYNQGPNLPHDNRIPNKGELLVKVTRKAKLTLRQSFVRRYGRRPSKRQLYKLIARQFGLRLSTSISGSQTLFVKGRRTNLVKIENAIQQGLVHNLDANFKVFAYSEPNDFFISLEFFGH